MKELGNQQYKLIYNDKRHQYGGSEWNVSMYFILQRLENISMKISQKISDEHMNKLRDILYRD